jgi:hypothetical protein
MGRYMLIIADGDWRYQARITHQHAMQLAEFENLDHATLRAPATIVCISVFGIS